MTVSDVFSEFCKGIREKDVDGKWHSRIDRISQKLNGKYYGNPDSIEHSFKVGSVGRKTATANVSDYDLIFELPNNIFRKYDNHKYNGQSDLLQDVKNCIKETYPNTNIKGDGQVVDVCFNDGKLIELVPAFRNSDNSFKYPDSNNGGKWKRTDPLPEQDKCKKDDINTNGTFRDICRILRVWRDNKSFHFKGILIDTMVDKYQQDNLDEIKGCTFSNYPKLLKNIFYFLSQQDSKVNYWKALGSNQEIYNNFEDSKFINKAKSAFNLLDEANLSNDKDVEKVFSDLLGEKFKKYLPKKRIDNKQNTQNYAPNEEFPDKYFDSIDCIAKLKINCIVLKDGFRNHTFTFFLKNYGHLFKDCTLRFEAEILGKQYLGPVSYYWKIRNYGTEAAYKNQLRGQIFKGEKVHTENTLYKSNNHYVECYAVLNGTVLAIGHIDVPIGDL